MAAGGARVCVIEGDLRRPRLLEYMGMDGALGLTNVLIGRADLTEVIQQFGETSVCVVGASSVPPNPSELLGSAAMSATLRDLETRFDLVIIDAPPLLPVTDAAVLNLIPTKGGDAYSYYRAGYAPESPRKRAKDLKRAGQS